VRWERYEGPALRVCHLLRIQAFSQEQWAAFDVTGEQGRVSPGAGVQMHMEN